ncbi:hypothetical protein ACFORG_00105 [Lutimaribacter marinistellae]|uniref:Uncharacterized protein n=1 Tax=Lutimaribacter marinistellae TaxID=1820329 RepID=A0ABV7TBW6_9RHOB
MTDTFLFRGTCAALAAMLTLATPAASSEVTFTFDRNLETPEGSVPYRLDLALRDVAPTRIAARAQLDLREAQAEIAQRLSNRTLIDTCNAHLELDRVGLTAENATLAAGGKVLAEFFACERERLQPVDRGEVQFSQTLALAAAISVSVADNCVNLRLQDLRLAQDGPIELTADQQEFLDQARTLLLGLVERVLATSPICLELPPELASLAPEFTDGGTVEIGDGGVGIDLTGSIDVSTTTIIDVLNLLQRRGAMPPRP